MGRPGTDPAFIESLLLEPERHPDLELKKSRRKRGRRAPDLCIPRRAGDQGIFGAAVGPVVAGALASRTRDARAPARLAGTEDVWVFPDAARVGAQRGLLPGVRGWGGGHSANGSVGRIDGGGGGGVDGGGASDGWRLPTITLWRTFCSARTVGSISSTSTGERCSGVAARATGSTWGRTWRTCTGSAAARIAPCSAGS
jgi:hypothetical protein